ncbi:15-hydroxyprostaglandin dehydrogenase [NAD(+)]-like [Kryptolebias marmoratus]|uniref:15-hydroxyprostaglandin dehydrogenase [NAD(+)] n=1 Tax=Kryptolebias marmoratus TaxID=37003 RepID=A0A3Q3B7N8_KRYMA|nr:15-hydroxyprostaglandin dehydrogenase [NAD(+)]-like [Kryptolebias marmoratus]XP_037835062.1 15-hydroxyprostaglandin dehydrogenase [NAD(+)]-like [Kryptolebias marmoratus]
MALEGKIAVVSGAAMGIGKAVVEILLQNGAKVVVLDINETAGQSLLEALNKKHGAGKTLFMKCNVESEEQLKAAFQKTVKTFGGVDIVCNNAGILNEEEYEKTISVNLTSIIRASYVALEHMNKLSGGRGGVIINTASMAGLGPIVCCPAYTAAKFGVVGFTRALAAASESLGYGIRINAVCPSFVQTDMKDRTPNLLGRFSVMIEALNEMCDKMGVLTTSDVAEGFMDLLKDETKNGQALLVMPKERRCVTFPSLQSLE